MNMLTRFRNGIEIVTKQINTNQQTSIKLTPGTRTNPQRDPKQDTMPLKITQLESKRIACLSVSFVLIYMFRSAKIAFLLNIL